ncbi:hypothetical protein L226DRAFT_522865 [Lentinus tigrinus ALCF2SS1-7]|uniref:Uncharacterized protein n=1 Tax=Lentinus tigrinus ALCF2SS1-6 TaxID=1328759 RepID=A0A5C2SB98_9APHY|nr:hypothetical protein L227DRAFT_563048 [Lentinus tigrinus ALCF2SS1-6]RPD75104.1 hypothetical protein L226DRAFT_522865 [Lentinus tigrinus ALCF2SS1-7]
MAAFWHGLAAVAPKLRCLDLAIEPSSSYARSGVGDMYQEIALYLSKLSFRSDDVSLPIRCLRVGMSFSSAFGVPLSSRAWFNEEESAEDERPVAHAIRALPGTIAAAIPTLQYLAISTQADYYPIVVDDWYNDESDYDLHALDADVTWWRIEREGGHQIFHRMGMTDATGVWRSLIETDDAGTY